MIRYISAKTSTYSTGRFPARSERAQTLVEFALAFPIFLLLVFGIIEVGRAMFFSIIVNTAAREGARYGAASGSSTRGVPNYADCDGIHAAATRMGRLAGIPDNDNTIRIFYDSGPVGTPTDYCTQTTACKLGKIGDYRYKGDRVIVAVCTSFQPIVPLANIPAFPMRSTSLRTLIKDIVKP